MKTNDDYERVINKLKKVHKHYFKLISISSKITDKTFYRDITELIEKILESENIEVTRKYD